MVETKNEAENLIYSAEKTLSEYKDKMTQEAADNLRAAIGNTREAISKDSLEELKAAKEALSQANMKVGESIYKVWCLFPLCWFLLMCLRRCPSKDSTPCLLVPLWVVACGGAGWQWQW